MRHKAFTSDSQIKLTDTGSGSIRFYGSTWLPWDRVRPIPERPVKGAFLPHLAAFIQDGFIAEDHAWGRRPIATVRDAGEDEIGLWVEAEFHSTDAAQAARTTVAERLSRGKTAKTSIGYDELARRYVPMDDPALVEQGIKQGKELTEIYLWEISLVNVPANPAADVLAVKAHNPPRGNLLALVKDLYEGGSDEWEVQDVLYLLLRYVSEGRLLANADPAALMIAANLLTDAQSVVGDLLASAPPTTEAKQRRGTRPSFDRECAIAEAALRAVGKRAARYQAARAKEGRVLSSATRGKLVPIPASLRELADILDTLLSETEPPAKRLAAEWLRAQLATERLRTQALALQ